MIPIKGDYTPILYALHPLSFPQNQYFMNGYQHWMPQNSFIQPINNFTFQTSICIQNPQEVIETKKVEY